MAKAEITETMHMTKPSVVGATGSPLREGFDYAVPLKFARVQYQRGLARPAAMVYLERLRALGLFGITIRPGSEPSMDEAAKALGLPCKSK